MIDWQRLTDLGFKTGSALGIGSAARLIWQYYQERRARLTVGCGAVQPRGLEVSVAFLTKERRERMVVRVELLQPEDATLSIGEEQYAPDYLRHPQHVARRIGTYELKPDDGSLPIEIKASFVIMPIPEPWDSIKDGYRDASDTHYHVFDRRHVDEATLKISILVGVTGRMFQRRTVRLSCPTRRLE